MGLMRCSMCRESEGEGTCDLVNVGADDFSD